MIRKIIKIDEDKCTGCGLCIPNCPEGAIQIIDGKARLISDLFCDGLGACLGNCPEGAIEIEEREAVPYNEKEVMKTIVKQGKATILAHLTHLKYHGEDGYLKDAIEYIKENNIDVNVLNDNSDIPNHQHHEGGCPGARAMDFRKPVEEEENGETEIKQPSQLRQWPVQLHLISPTATYFKNADVVLAADCVAFAMGNFHSDYLKGKSLAIACPKLDNDKEVYVEKISAMIDQAKINTLTVMIMEVPCCSGLLQIAKMALEKSQRKVPIKVITVSLKGDVIQEEWI
ncbi:MAG: 4Fe-4S binding protein [Bacteroidota bacterium]|nr:4Fe-4S binding protein [Bacteroidota bacterium]